MNLMFVPAQKRHLPSSDSSSFKKNEKLTIRIEKFKRNRGIIVGGELFWAVFFNQALLESIARCARGQKE